MAELASLTEIGRSTLLERIAARTDRSGACHLWTGTIQHDGYGQIHFGATVWRVHRVVLEADSGPLGELLACHTCDVRHCLRRSHLFAGTVLDNARDAVAKGRYATGLRQGMHTHPESRARGIANGKYTHPESTPIGEQHGQAKLTEVEVRIIRISHAAGISTHELSRTFRVSRRLIDKIVDRALWRHVA